ncbi:hypothetical protein yc1106_02582 [Curvularia clavata]|uniref:Biotrophy-associated secreted protein 2 n=1 Tax=Curvularia clavata TaxID=95742 RepID=A0A9Q9DPL3_CURCL|nr:hypothetical protein yc1106_02582 [Curvularia clavata]
MAPILKLLTLLNFSLFTAAAGTQFITGVCASDAECASGCCGFTSGKCAAPFVANERGEGCGFGDARPNNNALNASKPAAEAQAPPAAQAPAAGQASGNVGAAQPARGTQFITGPCTSDADCASACCGFRSGKCAGPVVAQERDGGCGFGNPTPNDDAARALQGRSLGRRGPAYM